MDDKIYDEASETDAVDGAVAVDGPDGVDVLLTPEAAAETSDRLLRSAMSAQGQRAEAERKRKERSALGFGGG
jgi:hypothetical protein